MLVLQRKQNETIRIGNDITIKIVKSGKYVKVGIDAPRGVRVVRGEIEESPVAISTIQRK